MHLTLCLSCHLAARFALLCSWMYGDYYCCCRLVSLQWRLPSAGPEYLLPLVWTLCCAHPSPHVSERTHVHLLLHFFTTLVHSLGLAHCSLCTEHDPYTPAPYKCKHRSRNTISLTSLFNSPLQYSLAHQLIP